VSLVRGRVTGGICLTAARTLAHSQNRRFKFEKRRQFFIRTPNETLSVVAMRVDYKDGLPIGINR
jgi:hypothetical protein